METSKFTPSHAVHPFEILKDEILAMGIKQKDFAELIGMKPSNFSRMMKYKSDLTVEMALRLEKATGIPFEDWMHYQKEYYLDMVKIGKDNLNKISSKPISKLLHVAKLASL